MKEESEPRQAMLLLTSIYKRIIISRDSRKPDMWERQKGDQKAGHTQTHTRSNLPGAPVPSWAAATAGTCRRSLPSPGGEGRRRRSGVRPRERTCEIARPVISYHRERSAECREGRRSALQSEGCRAGLGQGAGRRVATPRGGAFWPRPPPGSGTAHLPLRLRAASQARWPGPHALCMQPLHAPF